LKLKKVSRTKCKPDFDGYIYTKLVILPSSPSKSTEVEDLKTKVRDVITTINTGMLGRTMEELEFLLDVLRATRGSYIEVH
jgi:hypothetical protein